MEIDKQNGDVAFSEKDHVYWNVNDNAKYISVTTLIHRFTQEFDKDFWSAYKTLEKLIPKENWAIEKKSLLNTHKFNKDILEVYNISEKDFNKAQQQLLDEWEAENKKSCERGTKIHADLENSFYKVSKNISLQKFGIGGKFECKKDYSDLDLEYGVYPEYLISRESDDNILRLAGQIDLLIKSGNEFTIVDYKGLPLDTPILTSNGWSTMKELKVGDKVFDKDGNLCNVTVKSSVHNNPCCKINFDNSESITADIDHRWLISFKKSEDSYEHKVMTTLELKNYLDSIEIKSSYNIPIIINAKPINPEASVELPLDSYVLGVWLGSDIYGIEKTLSTVLDDKYIPEIYLLASYEDRLSLLQGIMDTKGHSENKEFAITTSSSKQTEGIIQLISSLGCKVSTINEKSVTFTTDKFNPFRKRHVEIKDIVVKENNSFRNIESVEFVESVPTQCIAVDSPSHTYLCTHSLIVTHNTNKKIDTKSGYNTSTRSTSKMKYPLNTLDDCNFYHYTMQLSTYAWMIQKLNPNYKIKNLYIVHYDHNNKETIYKIDYLKDEVERMLCFYKKELIAEQRKNERKRIEY